MARLLFYPDNWLHGKDKRLKGKECSEISSLMWCANFFQHFILSGGCQWELQLKANKCKNSPGFTHTRCQIKLVEI